MVTLIQNMMNVFKKDNNTWMDYNEIYNQMDKSLFGPNKHGERGKRNIVYRLLLGYNIFDIDENFRPKKFRLKAHILDQSDTEEVERVYLTGDIKIFFDNTQFEEVKFSYEADFEAEIKENYQLIFGSDSIYYDAKSKIGNRICDGIVFNKKNKKVYIIEAELFVHDLYGHIVPQIIDFLTAMQKEEIRHKLKYDLEWNKEDKLEIIEALDNQRYDIVVIIDRITFKIEEVQKNIAELIRHFVKNQSINIIFKEFNIFVDEKQNKIFRVK